MLKGDGNKVDVEVVLLYTADVKAPDDVPIGAPEVAMVLLQLVEDDDDEEGTGATHLVQTVEVLVLVIVETVVVTWVLVLLPDVMVLVTGQLVTVVMTT